MLFDYYEEDPDDLSHRDMLERAIQEARDAAGEPDSEWELDYCSWWHEDPHQERPYVAKYVVRKVYN